MSDELQRLIEEAKMKQKTSERIGFVKESVLNMIKHKQQEIYGTEPKTMQEQILTISDPAKRKQLLMQDSKCQELKHDMDYVTSDAEVFDEFFNRFKRIQQSKEEKTRSRQATDVQEIS